MRGTMRGVRRDKCRNRFCIVLVVESPCNRSVMHSVMRDKIIWPPNMAMRYEHVHGLELLKFFLILYFFYRE